MAAKAIKSVWVRDNQEAGQPVLSRAAIVREAIAMLDAEGVEALSMRKLGARLNAGATSLYRHVANKDELMELAVDEVAAEISVPSAALTTGPTTGPTTGLTVGPTVGPTTGLTVGPTVGPTTGPTVGPAAGGPDWRAAAAQAAGSFRATALRHPWLASVLGQAGLAYLGPNLMSVSERLAALFTTAGFPDPSGAIDALLSYVIGMSTTEAAWLTTVARSGETEADFVARLMPAARQAAAGYDHLAEAYYATPPDPDPARLRDTKFANGLDIVLDGLATRLPRPSRPEPIPPA